VKRILLVLTVALVMAALVVANIAPAFAGPGGAGHQAYKHCKQHSMPPPGC